MNRPTHCEGCKFWWSQGVYTSMRNNWCCKFAKPADKAKEKCASQRIKAVEIK
jgi:hypothetical protein